MTSSTTPQDRAGVMIVEFLMSHFAESITYLGRRADELASQLADAGLLSSGTQEEGDGPLRSGPAATGQVQWAALPPYHSSIHDDRDSAVASVAFVRECGDECSLYEIHEVTSG